MKHFNSATIWGRIKDLNIRHTKKKKLLYADLQIYCPSNQHGDVLVFGRLWGAKKAENLNKLYLSNPLTVFKFKGMFTQFKDRDITYTGFNLFNFEVSDEQRMRTVFILVGECKGKRDGDNKEGIIILNVKTGGDGTYREDNSTFEIFMENSEIEGLHVGDIIECKGIVEDKDAYFGSSIAFKPYAHKLLIKKQAIENEIF